MCSPQDIKPLALLSVQVWLLAGGLPASSAPAQETPKTPSWSRGKRAKSGGVRRGGLHPGPLVLLSSPGGGHSSPSAYEIFLSLTPAATHTFGMTGAPGGAIAAPTLLLRAVGARGAEPHGCGCWQGGHRAPVSLAAHPTATPGWAQGQGDNLWLPGGGKSTENHGEPGGMRWPGWL